RHDIHHDTLQVSTVKVLQPGATDSTTSNYFYTVNFNSEKVDKQVRKALSHAVDRDAINVLVNEGTGIVADLPLVEGQEGYTTDITTYPYDVELSKSMLKEAGYDESNPQTLDFFYGEGTEN
ncbi:ABC transporter substrate-binding protein, partial [Anaerotruncus colihominis]|uniref:ABC transporter substrate-binding protein n=1 Tax=Anaerotruncus colihominis TaxID=169435 RepID=UPI00210CB9B7